MQPRAFAACDERNEAEEVFEHREYHKILSSQMAASEVMTLTLRLF